MPLTRAHRVDAIIVIPQYAGQQGGACAALGGPAAATLGDEIESGARQYMNVLREAMKLAHEHLYYIDHLIDHRPWLAGATMSLADLAAAAQISVADYLGGLDWTGHDQARDWYAVFKSRPSFRPLLAERMEVIQPPSHYADVNA